MIAKQRCIQHSPKLFAPMVAGSDSLRYLAIRNILLKIHSDFEAITNSREKQGFEESNAPPALIQTWSALNSLCALSYTKAAFAAITEAEEEKLKSTMKTAESDVRSIP